MQSHVSWALLLCAIALRLEEKNVPSSSARKGKYHGGAND